MFFESISGCYVLMCPSNPHSQFIFVGRATPFDDFGNFLLAANPSKRHSKHEEALYSFKRISSFYVSNTCSHDDNNYNNGNNNSVSVSHKNNNYLAVTNSNIVITLSFFISLICYAIQLQQ